MGGIRALALTFAVLFAVFAAPAAAHGDRDAHHSLREAVTDQNFYFVMADRFDNGIPAQRPRRPAAGQERGAVRIRPDRQGLVPRRRPAGPARPAPLHQAARHHGDLADAELQEQGRPGQQRLPVSRLPRLLDHRLHADRPAPGHQRRPQAPDPGCPPARASRSTSTSSPTTPPTSSATRRAPRRTTSPRISTRTGPPRAPCSTTATSQAGARSRRWRRPVSHLPAAGPLQSFPYHPCVPAAEQNVKVPAWLNDVSLYHNRGNTTFAGENSQYGDFFGLDDLFTENPRVVDGMIDIYKFWIREFRVDGFRMDTMKHVDDPFWQRFAPDDRALRAPPGHPRLLHVRRGRRGLRRRDHVALPDP